MQLEKNVKPVPSFNAICHHVHPGVHSKTGVGKVVKRKICILNLSRRFADPALLRFVSLFSFEVF